MLFRRTEYDKDVNKDYMYKLLKKPARVTVGAPSAGQEREAQKRMDYELKIEM